jgi:ribosomal-protein-alanine N-acetyltransferase
MDGILTERLRLIPHRPEELKALMRSEEEYEQVSGRKLAEGLRDFFVSGEVSQEYVDSLDRPGDVWAFGFAILLRDEQLVIGACGFKGPPDAYGMAEIAYGIAPGYQNRGYATEAAAALVAFATESGRVRTARAHTLPEPNASTRVLTKCGFTFAGEVVDPDDGRVWRWARNIGG